MHLLLTDRLTCPRCGPRFGLILLAREMRDRRVLEGTFGCSNCRDQYPVEEGFGDLRAPPRAPLPPQEPAAAESSEAGSGMEDPAEALRLAALMGVTEGPGTLLLVGPSALHGGSVSRLIPGIEVVGMDPGLRFLPQQEGVSRLVSRPGIPFSSGTFLGVTLSGPFEGGLVMEALRVLSPLGRIALRGPSPEVSALLKEGGLQILLEEDGFLVAQKGPEEAPNLVTLRGP